MRKLAEVTVEAQNIALSRNHTRSHQGSVRRPTRWIYRRDSLDDARVDLAGQHGGSVQLAMAFSLPVWTTALLLLNPMMPPGVALIHFRETLGSGLQPGFRCSCWLAPEPSAANRRCERHRRLL